MPFYSGILILAPQDILIPSSEMLNYLMPSLVPTQMTINNYNSMICF